MCAGVYTFLVLINRKKIINSGVENKNIAFFSENNAFNNGDKYPLLNN